VRNLRPPPTTLAGGRFFSERYGRLTSGSLASQSPQKNGEGRTLALQFRVCQDRRQERWIVRLDNKLYGDYLDKEQALLDAIDAAKDAGKKGREAQVWYLSQAARVF
jgi:hypothetical protein